MRGLLAVKNDRVCIFNNHEEEKELLSFFKDKETKVFLENEEKKALAWSKATKLLGFKMEYFLENFEKIQDLKNKEAYCVEITTIENKKYVVVLNDAYIIRTKEIMYWDQKANIFQTYKINDEKQLVNSFEKEIINLAIAAKKPISQAAKTYFKVYKDLFGVFPFKNIDTESINQFEESIIINGVCEDLIVVDDEVVKVNYNPMFTIKDNEIKNIKEKIIPRRIEHNIILDTIKKITLVF